MKRKCTFLSSVLIALSALLFVPSCATSVEINGIHMTSPETIKVPYGNFSYDGVNVTVDFADGTNKDIPLDESMISEVERLKFYKMGTQNVEVAFRNKYKTTMPIEVVLNKFNDTYELIGYECVYDGLPHYVTLNEELPEGAIITYPYGNMFTNAGTYEIVGVISKDGFESKTLNTTLTIHQAEKDGDDIVFEDATLIYNGEMRTIEATNIPEGVSVSYDTYEYDRGIRIPKVVNAGKYRIVAHFTDASTNYKKIPDKEAILTIEKANYDLSSVILPDVTRVYDGEPFDAETLINKSDLPMGITPKCIYLDENNEEVKSNAAAGTYTIVCDFIGGNKNNYNEIPSLKAKLTVLPKTITIANSVSFESKVVNFDETVTHSLAITGKLPQEVTVEYENNNKVYAGEYEVEAKFSTTNPNEKLDVETLTAYLVINQVRRAVHVYNEETQAYDKEFSDENISVVDGDIVVSGYNPEMFTVKSITLYSLQNHQDKGIEIGDKVDVSQLINGETYQYVVVFAYTGEYEIMNDSVILSNESDNFKYIKGA